MCASKLKGSWRRRARRVLVVGAISATTFAGSSSLRGESVVRNRATSAQDAVRGRWRDNPLVAQALAAARSTTADSDAATVGGQGETLIPLSAAGRISRTIY